MEVVMKPRTLLGALTLFCLGFLVGTGFDVANAQQNTKPEQAWEINHSPFGQHSFYVIKHNRLTGETWVLSGERGAKDDSWLLLPHKDKSTKK